MDQQIHMVFNFSIVGGTWGGGMGMVLVALPSIYAHIGKRTETGMYVSTYLLDRKKNSPPQPEFVDLPPSLLM